MLKKYDIMQILAIFVIINCCSHNNTWKKFNDNPNEQNYTICLQQIKEISVLPISKRTLLHDQLIVKKEIVNFIKLTENGNEYAVDLCFNLYTVLKNHVELIELFDITLGKLINSDTELFLKLLHKYYNEIVGKYTCLEGLLGNYGDEYVDETFMQIEETNNRIESLSKIKNNEFNQLIKECIEYYNKRLEFLKQLK